MMNHDISIRSPWLDLRLIVNVRAMNRNVSPNPRRPVIFTILRFGLSLCLPLFAAYCHASILCGIGLAICDIFMGQPSIEWYHTLHWLCVLCAVPWVSVWHCDAIRSATVYFSRLIQAYRFKNATQAGTGGPDAQKSD